MYNKADKSYMSQPKFMSDEIRDAMIMRIGSHAKRHEVGRVSIVIHGGEPLIFGKERLRSWVTKVRGGLLEYGVDVVFGMQSNGTLIDEEWIDLLADLKVTIGISIDGPERYHNKYRVDHQGNGSFQDVIQGIKLIREHPKGRDVFAGFLSVMNTDVPPSEFFDFMSSTGTHAFNVLFPRANYAYPPEVGTLSYGDWLIQLFDLWFEKDDPNLRVRLFSDAIQLFFGSKMDGGEGLGTNPFGLIVIETNGSIEPSDNLKVCGDGFTKLGLNVLTDELDKALHHPLVNMACKAERYLCNTCMNCDFVKVCGGGLSVERYSHRNGFDNPSVYCTDLQRLYGHIRSVILSSLPEEIINSLNETELTSFNSEEDGRTVTC
jgi:uncharacterized protein